MTSITELQNCVVNWKNSRGFTSHNNYVPYYSFSKTKLLALLEDPANPGERISDGIRFHLGRKKESIQPGKHDEYCMIATAVKNNSSSTEDVYNNIWELAVTSDTHTFPFQFIEMTNAEIEDFGPDYLALTQARMWIKRNQDATFDENKRNLAKDMNGQKTKIHSVRFANDKPGKKDILYNFIKSVTGDKIYVFLSSKLKVNGDIRVAIEDVDLTAFIITHTNDIDKAASNASVFEDDSQGVEFGNICPPACVWP